MGIKQHAASYLKQQTSAAPLAVFRICFGLLMLWSTLRFWALGWIEKRYIQPKFFFSYYGFSWIQPLGNGTYLLFGLCALSALLITLGYRYFWSMLVFFLSFTYIELLDKTTYLNHYYFVSVLSLIMLLLPAAHGYSMDALKAPATRDAQIPRWTIDSIKLFIGIVYVYAGLAKINSDWILNALPLRIWLPSNANLPLLGPLLERPEIAHIMSIAGMAYDLCIPGLLLYRRTRIGAFIIVIIFHLLTRLLFPIGMFPYIMIAATLIFFSAETHKKALHALSKVIPRIQRPDNIQEPIPNTPVSLSKRAGIVGLLLLTQILIPWRFLAYPGKLFWTEQGYRFSWRVMLMEKTGYAQFRVIEPQNGNTHHINNKTFLTTFQEKQMTTQPDFILQYANHLAKIYQKPGEPRPEVYVTSHVSLNGRRSKPFINPSVNLAELQDSWHHKTWIIPFQQ